MKTLLATILLFASLGARADYVCKTTTGDGLHVEMKISNQSDIGILILDKLYYTIEYYGQSRNTYKAEYQAIESNEFATDLYLFNDLSTWKNMPEHLKVLYFDHTASYSVVGLFHNKAIHFHPSECK